ncbi:hypothetical protein FQA39_LY14784 [Lamprigera yunnana]|nr:hypothetical protein FQA39_LY14784 [Lamprigera yunnana]
MCRITKEQESNKGVKIIRNPIAVNTRVVMEKYLQGNDHIESNTWNNLGAVDRNCLNSNTKQLNNLENMTVPDSDSEDNLALSHRIRRVNQSSNRFTDSLGIKKQFVAAANENRDGVENVNFSDDNYADPDYAPSGQSSDSEVEQALIKSTKNEPDNLVSENLHGNTNKAPKKEKRKQVRDTDRWKKPKGQWKLYLEESTFLNQVR